MISFNNREKYQLDLKENRLWYNNDESKLFEEVKVANILNEEELFQYIYFALFRKCDTNNNLEIYFLETDISDNKCTSKIKMNVKLYKILTPKNFDTCFEYFKFLYKISKRCIALNDTEAKNIHYKKMKNMKEELECKPDIGIQYKEAMENFKSYQNK